MISIPITYVFYLFLMLVIIFLLRSRFQVGMAIVKG